MQKYIFFIINNIVETVETFTRRKKKLSSASIYQLMNSTAKWLWFMQLVLIKIALPRSDRGFSGVPGCFSRLESRYEKSISIRPYPYKLYILLWNQKLQLWDIFHERYTMIKYTLFKNDGNYFLKNLTIIKNILKSVRLLKKSK